MQAPGQGHGQTVLSLDEPQTAPAEQLRDLIKLSDPALSELSFDALLEELLLRVRDLLGVDTAAILLIDENAKELVARAAKGIEEEVEAGVRIPIGVGFAGRIAKERVAIFIADVNHADILNPILREKGIRSLLGVPLIVEGELIGVLHVGSLHPRVFDQRDLAVLELAAARAAPAIERARLLAALEREHRTAVMLQRNLLPRRLNATAGISIAARYLPARDEVGGDWYDIVELAGGQIGVAIGDVVGHGLEAAMLMGQVRSALHAYAAEGHPPGHVLELVDRFTRGLGDHVMATAAYAIINPDTAAVRYSSAGHLPPVLIGGDGHVSVVEDAVAPPLGAIGYRRCPEHDLQLEEGATLMFYTDGLVERPRVSLRATIDELAGAVDQAQTAEEACLLAVDRMVPVRGPRDDVAVIACRNELIPPKLELTFAADPAMLTHVRHMLGRWLRKHEVARDVAGEITIAVSEACANAVEHAYGPGDGRFSVGADFAGDSVTVTIRDGGQWRPARGEHRGRGLTIMEAAMDAVEVASGDRGTVVSMRRRVNAGAAG